MKNFLFAFLALFILFGCSRIKPSVMPMTNSKVNISTGYLSFCSSFFTGLKEDVEIEIYIDGVNSNGQYRLLDSEYHYVDSDDTDFDNLYLDITTPAAGTWVATVIIRVNCSTCCSAMAGSVCGISDVTGRPRFRGMSGFVNSNGHAFEVFVVPQFLQCVNCGC